MDRSTIWLWLSLHFGAGAEIYSKLITYFEDEQNIYDCDDADVARINWLHDSHKSKLLDKNLDHAHEIIEWCEENEVQIIAYSDDNYPESLRELEDFPPILYCKGDFPDFDNKLSISLVGTRAMTTYGQKIAFELGYTLSRGGAITVSGMARGIDSSVAVGTINALGTTVAVLGCGIDVVYPRENASLMNKIIENGAIITEYPPHTPPNSWNFPVRNRIISGISNGTVVVEAPEHSGAMITARRAIKQRKPLFAVPGPARTHSSAGTNILIREDGAKLTNDAIDIFEEFLEEFSHKIDLTKAKQRPKFSISAMKLASPGPNKSRFYSEYRKNKKSLKEFAKKFDEQFEDSNSDVANDSNEQEIAIDKSEFSEEELKVFDAMKRGREYSVDELVDLTNLSAGDVMSAASTLQINGHILELPGGNLLKD